MFHRPSTTARLLPWLVFLAACSRGEVPSRFDAHLSGALAVTMAGGTAFTPTALTLTSDEGTGAIVFTRPAGAGLSVRSYAIGSGQAEGAMLDALIIAGTPSHPTGVFRGRAGTLTVTDATVRRLAGRFDVTAYGVLTDRTSPDSASVHVSGAFRLLHPCVALAAVVAPCTPPDGRATGARSPRLTTDTTHDSRS